MLSQCWKKILENKILKINIIYRKIVGLIVWDLIFPVTNLLLKFSQSFQICIFWSPKKYCFWNKSKKWLEKIDFRWARQETDHTSLITLELFLTPWSIVLKSLQKKYTFRFIRGPIRSFLIIFLRGHLGWRALNW